jgi:hypothetical protein
LPRIGKAFGLRTSVRERERERERGEGQLAQLNEWTSMIPISRTENLNGLPSELAIYESILPDLEKIFIFFWISILRKYL